MRLLLIEDHERFAKFVYDGLEKEGFTVDAVDTASSGEAARSTVQYDAIILDLGLPDSDGLTLLRSWRDAGDETPVLILTARDGVDDRVKGLNSGGAITC
jgi:DNA-binding response OmpR family regulator